MQPSPAIAVGQLVEAHKLGAERGCEVFSLARAQPDGHLEALQVACAPVVHDGKSRDALERAIVGGKIRSGLADHAGQFQLVIGAWLSWGIQTSASWPTTLAALEK